MSHFAISRRFISLTQILGLLALGGACGAPKARSHVEAGAGDGGGGGAAGGQDAEVVEAKFAVCGDNEIEGNEYCDGTDLGGMTCAKRDPTYNGGVLKCRDDCMGFLIEDCTKCGDGKFQPESGEECDTTPTKTCAEINASYTAGTVTCSTACKHVVTDCCGDGKVGAHEVCDGDDPNGCHKAGFVQNGPAICVKCQSLDSTACSGPKCGDPGTPKGAASCPAECTGGCPDTKTCVVDCVDTNPPPADLANPPPGRAPGKCEGEIQGKNPFECPPAFSCIFNCKGYKACTSAKLTGNILGNVLVNCEGYMACNGMLAICGAYSGVNSVGHAQMKVDGAGTCLWNCGLGLGSCGAMQVACGQNRCGVTNCDDASSQSGNTQLYNTRFYKYTSTCACSLTDGSGCKTADLKCVAPWS